MFQKSRNEKEKKEDGIYVYEKSRKEKGKEREKREEWKSKRMEKRGIETDNRKNLRFLYLRKVEKGKEKKENGKKERKENGKEREWKRKEREWKRKKEDASFLTSQIFREEVDAIKVKKKGKRSKKN